MNAIYSKITGFLMLFLLASSIASGAELYRKGPVHCADINLYCYESDVVVFVHGIYGSQSTFYNSKSNFDWPSELAKNEKVDTYVLEYKTELLSWAAKKNPSFVELSKEIFDVLGPLRERRYRSINFVVHSLGGNIIAEYLHTVKIELGHANRAQHGAVIQLATPVLGSQVANIGSFLKSALLMDDDLLDSLKSENLHLRMLDNYRSSINRKSLSRECRPTHLYAAFEKNNMGPFLIVPRESAANSVAHAVNSPVRGFDLDHSEIAKPSSYTEPVAAWVKDILARERHRLWEWNVRRPSEKILTDVLCGGDKYRDEKKNPMQVRASNFVGSIQFLPHFF